MIAGPLVSIVVPAYNAENTIEATVRSVIAQTYERWELLICDDSSTDRTNAIVSDLCRQNSKIKLFRNEVNRGPALSRNTCLDNASGKLVAFLDADDHWHPDKLLLQISHMVTTGDRFTHCNYDIIFNSGGEKKLHRRK